MFYHIQKRNKENCGQTYVTNEKKFTTERKLSNTSPQQHQFQLKSIYFDSGGHWTGHWRFKYWRKGVENILTSTASSVAECKKWGEVDILTAGPKKNSVEVKRWPIPIVFNHHFEESMCSFFFWGNGARQMIEWLRSQTNSFHLLLEPWASLSSWNYNLPGRIHETFLIIWLIWLVWKMLDIKIDGENMQKESGRTH